MPVETAFGTPWIGGWVGPRASLDEVARRKNPYSQHSEDGGEKTVSQLILE
jgi:hypothetical protein